MTALEISFGLIVCCLRALGVMTQRGKDIWACLDRGYSVWMFSTQGKQPIPGVVSVSLLFKTHPCCQPICALVFKQEPWCRLLPLLPATFAAWPGFGLDGSNVQLFLMVVKRSPGGRTKSHGGRVPIKNQSLGFNGSMLFRKPSSGRHLAQVRPVFWLRRTCRSRDETVFALPCKVPRFREHFD